MTITEINTDKTEGQLLIAAIAIITGYTGEDLDQALEEVSESSEKMFE